jgi:predicted nucleic acid-binding protein
LPDVICDTSPLQYLHQLELLHVLPALAKQIIVPPAVLDEVAVGRAAGVILPDLAHLAYIAVRHPKAESALPLVSDLGPGETEVLMLGLELRDSIVILDDALGRRIAEALALKFTGTLGLLLDAKRCGLIPSIRPLLDQLQDLRFRLSLPTRQAILQLAGEER